MKKTIREWLKELPEDVRDKALFNYAKSQRNKNKTDETLHFKTQKQALKMAFAWYQTPEGFKFWEKIWEKL